jgi:hypothetical protein
VEATLDRRLRDLRQRSLVVGRRAAMSPIANTSG